MIKDKYYGLINEIFLTVAKIYFYKLSDSNWKSPNNQKIYETQNIDDLNLNQANKNKYTYYYYEKNTTRKKHKNFEISLGGLWKIKTMQNKHTIQ